MSSNNNNNNTPAPLFENKYYEDWVKQNIGDLTGMVAIITGSNSGTGFWAAHALAGKGCTVVMACRNPKKAEAAKAKIMESFPEANVDASIPLDNMDLSSVRSFATKFGEKYDRLDYLLNNAGIMAQPLQLSKDGFDVQFQTNHLSHFLLTKLLWNKILATPGQSRIVQHSSMAHYLGYFDSRNYSMSYPATNWFWGWLMYLVAPLMGLSGLEDRWSRYGMSKLCNVLFMKDLARKIEAANLKDKVISTACHPGSSNTNLQTVAGDASPSWDRGAQSAADGSLPLLMATLDPKVQNGDYTGPKSLTAGPPVKSSISRHGRNVRMAEELWDYSEYCITKESFAVYRP